MNLEFILNYFYKHGCRLWSDRVFETVLLLLGHQMIGVVTCIRLLERYIYTLKSHFYVTITTWCSFSPS